MVVGDVDLGDDLAEVADLRVAGVGVDLEAVVLDSATAASERTHWSGEDVGAVGHGGVWSWSGTWEGAGALGEEGGSRGGTWGQLSGAEGHHGHEDDHCLEVQIRLISGASGNCGISYLLVFPRRKMRFCYYGIAYAGTGMQNA